MFCGILGAACALRLAEGWSVIDTIYFTTTVIMTVGYGDVVPQTATGQLLTCILVLMALLVIGTVLRNMVQYIVELEVSRAKQARRVRLVGFLKPPSDSDEEDGLFAKAQAPRQRLKRRCTIAATALALWLGVAVLLLRRVLGVGVRDAAYFAMVTATTLGLGDTVPTTAGGKLLVTALMLTGVPLLGNLLAQLGNVLFGKTERTRPERASGALCPSRLNTLRNFCQEMDRQALYVSVREGGTQKISPFEYMAFALVRSKVLEMEDIGEVMKDFYRFDVTRDGFIDEDDIRAFPGGAPSAR